MFDLNNNISFNETPANAHITAQENHLLYDAVAVLQILPLGFMELH